MPSPHELQVAVYAPVSSTYRYTAPEKVPAGSRVLVPFGARKLVGVVLGKGTDDPDVSPTHEFQLKEIINVIDPSPVYSPVLMQLAQWLSSYYMHPIGEVFKAMLPASVQSVSKESVEFTAAGQAAKAEPILSAETDLLAAIFAKKHRLSKATFQSKLKKNAEGFDSAALVSLWLRQGYIRFSKEKKITGRSTHEFGEALISSAVESELSSPKPLTPEQTRAFEVIEKSLLYDTNPKPALLYGITGSGKTEIYLQLIAKHFEKDANAQVLVLVPEISLTPQMTHVFSDRFGGKVAVVHSAMSDSMRWQQLENIRQGQASILIGPRSAVFAPFNKLSLIIVDEEHDGSYKQGSGLLYHARDTAVVRAKMEGAGLLLGSATPSLESYQNALSEKYTLVELLERVEGRPLPEVEVLEVKAGHSFGQHLESFEDGKSTQKDEVPMATEIISRLKQNFAEQKQSIVIVNRRGYSFYIFSTRQRQAVRCPNCAISLTLHKNGQIGRCHYCDYSKKLADIIAEADEGDHLLAVGYGSEKVEGYLKSELEGVHLVRLDSDISSKREELHRIISEFREGKIDVLVGTQILAKGHDFAKVTLIALLELDQSLNFPDFRSGEKTFQLIVQAAGRAGRDQEPGKVLLQTSNPEHPVVNFAITQNFKKFAAHELEMRASLNYPPFSRMILVELSSVNQSQLVKQSQLIARWIDEFVPTLPDSDLHVLGPSVPSIEFIRKRYRRTILVSSRRMSLLKAFAQSFQQRFSKLPRDMAMKIDVDPQSLV